jgi:hypothetical protein
MPDVPVLDINTLEGLATGAFVRDSSDGQIYLLGPAGAALLSGAGSLADAISQSAFTIQTARARAEVASALTAGFDTLAELNVFTGMIDGDRTTVEQDGGLWEYQIDEWVRLRDSDAKAAANAVDYLDTNYSSLGDRMGPLEEAVVREVTITGGPVAWTAATVGLPATAAYRADAIYIVNFATAPQTGATIDIDGRGALPIQDRKGSSLVTGDVPINEAFLGRVKSGAFRLFARFASAQPVADPVTVVTLTEARSRDLGTPTRNGTLWTASTTGALPTSVYRTDVLYVVQFTSEPLTGDTIAVDGLPALPIQDRKGSPLITGDVPINEAFLARVRSGGFRLLTRFASALGNPDYLDKKDGPLRLNLSGASTASAQVATTTPAFTAYRTGQPLYWRPLAAIASGVTMSINGQPPLPITDARTGLAIDPNQVTVFGTYVGLVQYGAFQLLNFSTAGGSSGGSAVVTTTEEAGLAKPLPLPNAASRMIQQAYGQSLEAGYRRAGDTPLLLSTTALYSALTFAAGPRSNGVDLNSEIGLIETDNYFYTGGGDVTSYGETSASGFVWGFVRTAAKYYGFVHEEAAKWFMANAARGATSSSQLVPTTHPDYAAIGSEPMAPFDVMKAQITAANARAVAAAETAALYCLTGDQGQGEEAGGTTATGWLNRWLGIYDGTVAHAQSVTGQTFDPMMLFSQVYSGTRVADGQSIADAQRQLEVERPGRCFLFMPTHQLALKAGYGGKTYHSDGHLSAVGIFYVGAMRGRSFAHALFKGIEPPRMRPIGATYDGTTVRLNLHVPTVPAVIDTSEGGPIGVGRVKDGGLAIEDATGIATLTSVAVGEGGSRVLLTPNRALSGEIRIRGGRDYLAPIPGTSTWSPGSAAIQVDYSSSAVLALRDSTAETFNIDGNALPTAHWCPSFDMRVSNLT